MKRLSLFISAIIISFAALAQQAITAEFPKATLSGKNAGEITVNEIITAGELGVTNSGLKIVRFALSLNVGADLVTYTSTSSKLTSQMIGAVKTLEKGKKLFIEDIETVNSGGLIIKLEALNLTIK